MKKLNNKAETIVEVLISIAVVAGVLGAAYYLLNRSYRQSQDAVERVAAIKAVESKLEVLRVIPDTSLNVDPFNNGSTKFCVSTSGPITYNSTDVKTDCIVNKKYTVTTLYNTTAKVYEITAEWSGLLQDKESVTIYYRP